MPLYIRDDQVASMAQKLAGIRGTTVTDAVRRALARELADADREEEMREEELRRLFAAFDASPEGRPFGDDEMYDEHGLPR